jgi:hypothetical protein
MQWKDRYRFKRKDRNMNLKLAEKKIRHTNKDTKERQIQIQSKKDTKGKSDRLINILLREGGKVKEKQTDR